MSILIQPYPHVYTCYNSRAILFLNTITKKLFHFSTYQLEYKIDRGVVLILHVNKELANSIRSEIVANDIGYISEGNRHTFYSIDAYSEHKKSYIESLTQGINFGNDNTNSYLFGLNVLFNTSELLYEHGAFTRDDEIDLCVIGDFLTRTTFPNLNTISLIGVEMLNSINLHTFVKQFHQKFNLRMIVPYSTYMMQLSIVRKSFRHIKFQLVCDDMYRQDLNKLLNLPKELQNNISVIYPFSGSSDIKYVAQIKKSHLKLHIEPMYQNNYDFLYKYISYDENDILSANLSMNDILRRDLINEFFFGQLRIQNNGSVYVNPLLPPLGSLQKHDVSEIIAQASVQCESWLYSRNRFNPCKECNYKNLCPPLSMVELESKRVLPSSQYVINLLAL